MTPKQIDAMKLALEALEEAQTNDDGTEKWDRNKKAITAIKEALAQPEQEPVCDKDPQGCWNVRCQLGKKCKNTPPQRTQPNDIDLFWRAVTTPEKWVGLTAEEVLQCWEKAHEPGNKEHINAIRMADEVEQALKEKNCG